MRRVRITIRSQPGNPADDLRWAARIRRDLWAHSPVDIDPDSPVHGTHRDAAGNAYFELTTSQIEQVERVLKEYDYSGRAVLSIQEEEVGPACENCGNIAGPVLPTVCPSCSFRNTSPCSYCNREIPRQKYVPVVADTFECPECRNQVRLRYHDPLFNAAGYYNQPLVIVERAVEAAGSVR